VNKSEIRKKILQLRKKNYFKNLIINSNKILKFLEKKNIKNKIIGAYYPYNYEIDTLEILKKLEKNNYLISLPKINKNNKMNFYHWSFKDPLSINVYGIPEPTSKNKVNPEILLIPLVAYDKELNRLGYGGGFYDRYLSSVQHNRKIIKIGLGYSFQKINKLPTNKYDKKLDYIMTEKNFI
tara:strand:- start:194 stop:736 length:543 start_codon:yes stop_codon:yes gene_type:complete